jgi:hypothetical protein
MFQGGVWLPLVVLFVLRAARGIGPVSNGALAGAALGMAFLAGHHQVPMIAGLLLAALLLARRLWLSTAAFALFVFCVSALQMLPAYEYGRLAVRWVGSAEPVGWATRVPYWIHSQYALPPLALVGLVVPVPLPLHADPFLGPVALTLAIAGGVVAWRKPFVRWLLLLAAGAAAFAVAGLTPLHPLLVRLVPMIDKARNPAQAIVIFHLAAAIMIAIALDAAGVHTRRRAAGALGVFGIFLFALLIAASLLTPERLPVLRTPALLGLTSLLGAIFLSRGAGAVALGALMLIDFSQLTPATWAHRDRGGETLKSLSQHSTLFAYLRELNQPVRVAIADQPPYNFGDWYGVDVFGGYVASLPSRIQHLQGNRHLRALFGVNYRIANQPVDKNEKEVFVGPDNLKIYSIPEAFPRVWTVHQVRAVEAARIEFELDRPLEEHRRIALVTTPAPVLETCAPQDPVQLVERLSNRVVIQAKLGCRGMVIVSEPWFPGWRATVDGRPAPIVEVYGVLRGVVVEAGAHRIEMRYLPWTVLAGAVLTALGLLGAILIFYGQSASRNSLRDSV